MNQEQIAKNWRELIRPRAIDSDEEKAGTYWRFSCEPLERGFGVTLGNSLRRVLLSSLQGAAITALRIDGVLHEFSTIPGVMEDVSDIVLNLKEVRLRMHSEGPKLLRVRGEFTALLEGQGASDRQRLADRLLEVLADRTQAEPGSVPPGDLSPEWARKLSAPFVLDPVYGTRCSTVLAIGHDDSLLMVERRFDAAGVLTGQSEHRLNGQGGH